MSAELSPGPARRHVDEVMQMAKDSVAHSQTEFLNEVVSVVQKHGREKGWRILDRLHALRRARDLREFHKYTTKPCGCYFDPGGHP